MACKCSVSGSTLRLTSVRYRVRQNFGIIVAFGVAFVVALLVFTEFNTRSSSENAVVLFKQGSNADIVGEALTTPDEEKANIPSGIGSAHKSPSESKAEITKAPAEDPPLVDIFSWQHIQYTVTVSGHEKKRLLDDVSGYVAPGKLTALMGESGAGKVLPLLSLLACNTDMTVSWTCCRLLSLMFSLRESILVSLVEIDLSMAKRFLQISKLKRT